MPSRMESNGAPKLAIIGGGIAGIVQAIHLAEKYPWLEINVFEKNERVLTGTSSMNPGRPTFGFHYRHVPTATFCQDNTVKFSRYLENIGCPNIFANAPQQGIYALVKDAVSVLTQNVKPVFDADEIETTFQDIRGHAIANYSEDDFFIRHFGHPSSLCRKMSKDEFAPYLTPTLSEKIGSCYETAEKTFNTVGIAKFLRGYCEKFANIHIVTNARVQQIEKVQQAGRTEYHINWTDQSSGESRTATVSLLILACWERVGLFRNQLGVPADHPTHNRLKMLAILEIDQPVEQSKTIRPIFVASGPFSMISPQELIKSDDGRVVCRVACTLAIKTNVMNATDNEALPEEYEKLIDGKIAAENKLKLGEPILEGARQFFACLDNAKLVDVRFGTVRVPSIAGETVDIHDPASKHHARDDPGCYKLGEGLYTNEAMKMIYSVHNAERIMNWIANDIESLVH